MFPKLTTTMFLLMSPAQWTIVTIVIHSRTVNQTEINSSQNQYCLTRRVFIILLIFFIILASMDIKLSDVCLTFRYIRSFCDQGKQKLRMNERQK